MLRNTVHGVARRLNNIANIWIFFLCEFSLSNVVDPHSPDDETFDAYLDLHPVPNRYPDLDPGSRSNS